MSNFPVPIAVDAMGGDHAPGREVEGAILAAAEFGIPVLLVGEEIALQEELQRHSVRQLPLEVVPASQVITMEDDVARSIRQKPDSSVRVAIRLVREGKAQGVVSAGNTGAVMALAKILLGTLPSVDRPALAAVFPPLGGTRTVLIDVGANVDCKPEQLRQFAIMGATYSRLLLNIPNPRVGLLSIGAEQGKGNELTRETYRLLQQTPLNFVGNVEGRDLYSGRADVIVCDGFIGNVALKISEGLAEAIQRLVQEVFADRLSSKAGDSFTRRIDYAETGGAPLLGVRGVCTICHGSSNASAIKNAIRMTAEFAAAGLNEKIEAELHKLGTKSLSRRRGRPALSA
ncbi:MAG: phosphate acyltransferase PlsX [Acidobacteria bacterium]|nr:phosphate acyltransferase PlsX [Acidobacteriota bacterium]